MISSVASVGSTSATLPFYRVRHDPERIDVALFDRVGGALTDPAVLGSILARYRFALNPAGVPG